MAKYVGTVKIGNNGAGVNIRDTKNNEVVSLNLMGPRKTVQSILKLIEGRPEVELKYE